MVGLLAGVGALGFRWLVYSVKAISFDWLPAQTASLGMAYVVIAPAVGGLLVGLLVYFFAREAKGHGVPEVMEAVALRGGKIRPVVAVVKSLASALSIGTGGSVGREGPIVQIGSTIGSTVGQVLGLSGNRIRNLVACGAAGGIAATFNAPIAGVIFALEVILADFGITSFGSVVIASVAASVVGRAAFGDVPAFVVPEYALNSSWELPMYVVLGCVAAAVAVLYTRTLYWSEDTIARVRFIPQWAMPAVGGGVLGLFALGYGMIPGLEWEKVPHVFSVGYETIEDGLLGREALGVMLALVFLKIIATSITLGSGGSGGVFAPSLFIGSMLGGAFGLAMHELFPGLPGPAGAYALVGMGAVFAGISHASMTAVIMIFEITGDYKIILPLMLAVVTSSLVSRKWMNHENIYTLKLSRRGVRLRSGRDVDVLERVRVEEVMSESPTVPSDTRIRALPDFFIRANRNALPVVDGDGRLVGIISLTDVRRAENRPDLDRLTVDEIMAKELVTAYLDETLDAVLTRMGPRDLSRLPVVDRDDETRLLGVIRRNDLVRAYTLGVARRRLESGGDSAV